MKGETILTLSGAALVALACGTTRLDAGSNSDGGTDAWQRGVPWPGTPSNSFDLKCDLPAPDWIAGAWQGEFDAAAFESGSKAVRIEFTGAREWEVCGTVTFGEGTPPPVASDPKAPPPGSISPIGVPFPPQHIIEGFVYEFFMNGGVTFDGGAQVPSSGVEDRRLQFGITQNQMYKSWCNLQLSYEQVDLSMVDPRDRPMRLFACLPRDAYPQSYDGQPLCEYSPVLVVGASCAQGLYCMLDVCTCATAGGSPIHLIPGCTVVPNPDTKFDLSLAGTTLSGNVVLIDGVEGLHLTRVP